MTRVVKQTIAYLKEVFQKPESRQGDFRYRDVLFFLQFVKPLWKLGLIGLASESACEPEGNN